MSIKTIKQRIAVVAVSALTVGVLSVVTAPVANASPANGDWASDLSIGLVGPITPSVATMTTGSTTRTATILTTGTLKLTVTGVSTVKVSAGALITDATAPSDINNTQTCAADLAGTNFVSIKPTGAAGSTFTVTSYSETTCATAATINEVLTVTIAATSVAGVANAGESTIRWDDAVSGSAPTAAEDATNASTSTGNTLELYMDINDAYAQPLATGGALIATVSSGAYIGTINTTGAAGSVSTASTTQVYTSAPTAVWLKVGEATAGAGWSGTVTIKHNDVVIATKTGKITGAPASLTVTPYKISRSSYSTPDPAWLYTVKDAAGNGLDFTGTDIVLDTSSNSAVVSDANGSSNSAFGATYGDYVGQGTNTCTATAGTSNVVVKTTLSNGTVLKSNSFTATCGGDAATYTASFDKASYVQGEVAVMTIVFRDARGNLANSTTAVDANASNASNATISAPMMAMVGSLGSNGVTIKPGLAGTLTVQFTVGTSTGLTDGSYNAVVSFPSLSTLGKTQSVAYKVTTGSNAVSNADVLKSIVSLIASINKQIQALQKLILKR